MEEIIQIFDRIFQNLQLKLEIYDQDVYDFQIYMIIYQTLFPFLSPQLDKIQKSKVPSGAKIQQFIDLLQSDVLSMDLSHISGDKIADGDIQHLYNFVQLLQELSHLYSSSKINDTNNEKLFPNQSEPQSLYKDMDKSQKNNERRKTICGASKELYQHLQNSQDMSKNHQQENTESERINSSQLLKIINQMQINPEDLTASNKQFPKNESIQNKLISVLQQSNFSEYENLQNTNMKKTEEVEAIKENELQEEQELNMSVLKQQQSLSKETKIETIEKPKKKQFEQTKVVNEFEFTKKKEQMRENLDQKSTQRKRLSFNKPNNTSRRSSKINHNNSSVQQNKSISRNYSFHAKWLFINEQSYQDISVLQTKNLAKVTPMEQKVNGSFNKANSSRPPKAPIKNMKSVGVSNHLNNQKNQFGNYYKIKQKQQNNKRLSQYNASPKSIHGLHQNSVEKLHQTQYEQLQNQKVDYIKKINKIMLELEKKKLNDLRRQQQEQNKERNEALQLTFNLHSNFQNTKVKLLQGKIKEQKLQNLSAAISSKEVIKVIKNEMKQEQIQQRKEINNFWDFEKQKFDYMIKDDGYLENKIMKLYLH